MFDCFGENNFRKIPVYEYMLDENKKERRQRYIINTELH